jgi:MinD-like ATPase involved in chromosome partitioning or flagellar assembly
LSKWLVNGHGSPTKTIAFTARSRKEGVTTVVAGLAVCFARTDPGKVLVVDVGSGRKRIADLLHVVKSAPENGHAEGKSEPPACVVRDTVHGLDIVTLTDTSSCRPGSAAEARAILDRLAPRYQIILVDAGAWGSGRALHWLAASNYRVLVVDGQMTTRESLEHQRAQLTNSEIAPDASILNRKVYPIPRALYWLAR